MKPVCLLTGAGGRLGRAACLTLAEHYDIVAVYRKNVPDVPSQLRWPIRPEAEPDTEPAAAARSVYCVQADLTKREDVRRVVEVALGRHGRIDAIVNSAADTRFHGRLVELWESGDHAAAQLAINCIAPFQLVSAVFQASWKDEPDANARWNRSVVNVSSASALYVTADRGQAFYSASKAALNMLTMYLSLELAPYSVRANAICPGHFSDVAATREVVDAIGQLLGGAATGTVEALPAQRPSVGREAG
jgi:NAD(P)-dependent dehydrogenase (short-subunit alcohol dehydrogenase family)